MLVLSLLEYGYFKISIFIYKDTTIIGRDLGRTGIIVLICTVCTVLFAGVLFQPGQASHASEARLIPTNTKHENVDFTLTITNLEGESIVSVRIDVPQLHGNALYEILFISLPDGWRWEGWLDDQGRISSFEYIAESPLAYIENGELEQFRFEAVAPAVENLYAWTITTQDMSGGTYSSTVFTRVDLTPPPAPNPRSPPPQALLNDNTPFLSWVSVAENSLPVVYQLQLDDGTDFSPPALEFTTLDNGFELPQALAEGVWNWRVRARDNAGNLGPWSSPWSFRIDVTPPLAPPLAGPENGAWINENLVNFDWYEVQDPSGISYELWVDDDPNFASPERRENLSASIYLLELADGSYVWKVRAKDGAGNLGPWSEVWTLVVDTLPPSTPLKQVPENGARVLASPLTFGWSSSSDELSGVEVYELWVDDDPSFTSPELKENTKDNSLEVALGDGSYWWRVRAWDRAGNPSEFEPPWNFLLDATPPAPPSPIAPRAGENLNTNEPTLRWSPVEDISFPVAYFAELEGAGNSGWILEAQWQAPPLAEGVWRWRVKAKDNVGHEGGWSPWSWFRIDLTPPLAPEPLEPEDNCLTNDSSPSLGWKEVEDPSLPLVYELWVDDDPSFTSPELKENTKDNSLEVALGDGSYWWRVRAWDNAGNPGQWSAPRSFTIDTVPPRPPPRVFVYPENLNLGLSNPELDWNPFEDESPLVYEVKIDDDPGFGSPLLEENLALHNLQLPQLPEGLWYWSLRALDLAGNESPRFWCWFRVDLTSPPAPGLLAPELGGSLNMEEVELEWEPVLDPSQPVVYEVEVDEDPGFLTPLSSGWIASTSWSTELGEGLWYWRVRARDNAGNEGNYSASSWFRVDLTAPNPPKLRFPLQQTLNDPTPELAWEGVDDPSTPVLYLVEVDEDPGFLTPLSSGWISSTAWTPQPLGDGEWYWRVRAKDGAGNEGEESQAGWFRVDTIPPQPAQPLEPASGALLNDPTPSFRWTAVEDPSGVVYTLEVDDSPGFESPELRASGLEDNFHTPFLPLPDGSYYWRVLVEDRVGNEQLDWSGLFFTLDTTPPAPPDLTLPPDEAYLNSRPRFEWVPVEDPSGVVYTLEVDDDPRFESPEVVREGLLAPVFYIPADEPLRDGRYYWRVRAGDRAGNEGEWSEVRTLLLDTAPPSPPARLSPAPGSFTNNPLLRWSAAQDFSSVAAAEPAGVASYELWVDDSPDFGSPVVLENLAPTTTSYLINLPDGEYWWRIYAWDRARNRSEPVEPWRFEVDRTPPIEPFPSSPPNASTVFTPSPTLEWEPVEDPSGVSYEVQVAQNPTFDPLRFTSSNLASSILELPITLADGTYYWRVRAVDGATNPGPWSRTWTFDVELPIPKFRARVPELAPGSPLELEVENLVLIKLTLQSPREVRSVEIVIEELTKRPANVPPPPGVVYRYLRFKENVDNLGVTLVFKVSKAWMSGLGIDPAYVALCKRSPAGWKVLLTTEIDEDENHVYYSATSSTSLFAVVGGVRGTPLFRVANLRVFPLRTYEGGLVAVSCTISNLGAVEGEYPVVLRVNGEEVQRKTVTLGPREGESIRFELQAGPKGSYQVEVDGNLASFEVLPKPTPLPPLLGISLVALVGAVAAITFISLRWRAPKRGRGRLTRFFKLCVVVFALLTCFEAFIGDVPASLASALATLMAGGFYSLHTRLGELERRVKKSQRRAAVKKHGR